MDRRLPRILFVLLSFLSFGSLPAKADEERVKIIPSLSQKESSISLQWESETFLVEKTLESKEQMGQLHAVMKGKFGENNWSLVLMPEDQSPPTTVVSSTNKDESFSFRVPLVGEKTHFVLLAVAPSGDQSKEEYDLSYDQWNASQQAPQSLGCGKVFCWKSAQLSPIYILNSTGSLASTLFAWSPSFEKPKYRIRANLGILPLRGRAGFFAALECSLLGSLKIWGPFWGEAMAGMQYWSDDSVLGAQVGGNVVYRLNRKVFRWIDQVSVGYSYFVASGNPTHEIRLGLGVSFGN